ncbi:hypothetical protein N0V83_006342, partial [Neocucurbitaria cava]
TPAGTRYTVEAIDPTNTAETEAQLKSLYGDNNVIIDGHRGESASWTITSDGDDLTGTIEALESVRVVQPKDAPQTGTGEGRRRLSRRNNGIYTVFAKKPNGSTDTKATEEFLRSKIQPGTNIYHFSNENGDITAWWGLRLDPDAKAAVENHEGVGKVSDDPGTNYARALPPSDEKYILSSLAQTDKRTLLDARSGKWEKQEAADDALVMVSQFE